MLQRTKLATGPRQTIEAFKPSRRKAVPNIWGQRMVSPLCQTKSTTKLALSVVKAPMSSYPQNGKLVVSKTRAYHGRVGAGRVGAGRPRAVRRGQAGRGGAGLDADGSFCPGDNRPSCPPGHRKQLSCMFLRKHEQTKQYVNRQGNKTSG